MEEGREEVLDGGRKSNHGANRERLRKLSLNDGVVGKIEIIVIKNVETKQGIVISPWSPVESKYRDGQRWAGSDRAPWP